MPHVDGVDAKRAPGEQAVGEPAGRRPHVQAHAALDPHPEGVEGARELLPAPPHEGRGRDVLDGGVGRDEPARLRRDSARQPNLAAEDQPRGLRAAARETARHQQLVQPHAGAASGLGRAHAKKCRIAASRTAASVSSSGAST